MQFSIALMLVADEMAISEFLCVIGIHPSIELAHICHYKNGRDICSTHSAIALCITWLLCMNRMLLVPR